MYHSKIQSRWQVRMLKTLMLAKHKAVSRHWALGIWQQTLADSLLVEEELLMYYLSWLTLFLGQLQLEKNKSLLLVLGWR